MERANEAKEWMDSAKEWFDQESAAKTEREEEAERTRLAQEAEEAYEQRDRGIWKLESQIADLQGEIDGLLLEVETFQEMYDGLTEEEIEAGEGEEWLANVEEFTEEADTKRAT